MRRLLVLFLLLAGLAAPAHPVMAQGTAPPPAAVQELQRLLADPALRDWLAAQASPPAAPAPAQAEDESISSLLARLAGHRRAMAEGLPALPAVLGHAVLRLSAEAADRGVLAVLLLVVLFVGAGLLAEAAFIRLTRRVRRAVLTAGEANVAERLSKVGRRVALVLGAVFCFGAASLGTFLLLDLPPLLRDVAGRFLLAALIFRLVLQGCRVVLNPRLPHLRILPLDDGWALFWYRRLAIMAGIFLFGWAAAAGLRTLGAGYPHALMVAYGFGTALLAVVLATIWQRHARLAAGQTALAVDLALSLIAVAVLLLWIAGASATMWLLLVLGVLPLAIRACNGAVDHLLRPAGGTTAADGPPSVLAAAIERGTRALLILGAVWLLFWAWSLDLREVLAGTGLMGPIGRAVLNIALIAIVFDFVWHVARTAIDRQSGVAAMDGDAADPAEQRRRARLRTLLPILRTVVRAVVAATGVLMILSAMGVEIGPLIAGAGVVGVAVGFGSQALVRDIIAGLFYLLDDAFRVGEYIVAGSYKGTVEGFSLRSIRLRHHRGPLYTVPFGSLGAIQNMSRDWVITKLTFTVPFDTDIAKVKKVVKEVGKQLLADPELAPGFIEPLKSQGVDAIGDSGLVVRVKFTARPGTQFTIKRRANLLLNKAFADNGIEFVYPTVRVAGEGDVSAAAARAAIAAAQPAPPA
jgi:small-conductance mechanosensitive channel